MPTASTCSLTLHLPSSYPSAAALKERLLKAIHLCRSIDNDGIALPHDPALLPEREAEAAPVTGTPEPPIGVLVAAAGRLSSQARGAAGSGESRRRLVGNCARPVAEYWTAADPTPRIDYDVKNIEPPAAEAAVAEHDDDSDSEY